jgi:hypothetical protein
MANAMLRSGTDEGIAIATANKYANKHPKPGAISERVYKKHGVPREAEASEERE